jgi:HEAT repeat protein
LVKLAPKINLEKFCELLIKLLELGNYDQKTDSAVVLSKIGDIASAKKLLALLKENNYDWYGYSMFANVISKIGDSSLEPELAELLVHEHRFAREAGARIVGKLKISTLRPAILKLLKDEDGDVHRSAIFALGEIGDGSNIPDVLPFLDSKETSIVAVAISALGKFGDKSVADKLRSKLSEDYDPVQNAAITALAELNDTDSVPTLVTFVNDTERHIYDEERCEAIAAIAKLGATAVSSLIQDTWLNDESCDIRFASATALGELGDAQAIDVLIERLNDRCWASGGRVCDAAADSLEKIGTEKALEAVQRWRNMQPVVWDD